jgi:hypothetical protein
MKYIPRSFSMAEEGSNEDGNPMIEIEEILMTHIEKPEKLYPTQPDETAESKRTTLTILFLGTGVGGNALNWFSLNVLGWFIGELSFISTSVLVLGIYFLLFPKMFKEHYDGRYNAILLMVAIISLLIGFAHFHVLENGLY